MNTNTQDLESIEDSNSLTIARNTNRSSSGGSEPSSAAPRAERFVRAILGLAMAYPQLFASAASSSASNDTAVDGDYVALPTAESAAEAEVAREPALATASNAAPRAKNFVTAIVALTVAFPKLFASAASSCASNATTGNDDITSPATESASDAVVSRARDAAVTTVREPAVATTTVLVTSIGSLLVSLVCVLILFYALAK